MSDDPGVIPTTGGLARLYDNVQLQLPGVDLAVVQVAALSTLQEFCDRSTYYRQSMAWTMPPTIRSVQFDPYDGNTRVSAVIGVTGLDHYTVNPPGELIDTSWGDLSHSTRQGYCTLLLRPISLKGNLPENVLDFCFEGVLAGVMYRLQSQPSKPYSNARLAEENGRKYNAQITLARVNAEGSFSGQSSFRYPYWAAGRRRRQ